MTRRSSLIATLLLAIALVAACGGQAQQTTPATDAAAEPATDGAAPANGESAVVTVVTPYYANAATKEVLDAFEAEGEARGWQVDIVDTAGDFDRLNSAIQDAVTQQVDAIVLGMGDPGQMTRGLDAAAGAEIPVFAIDAAPAEGIVVNVTSDNADLGRTSAEWLVDAIGGSGTVLMFTHDPHPGVRARAEAAAEVLEEAGVTIAQRIHVEVPGPVENARTSMQDFLTANPGDDALQGVWAGWDEPALGATQAIEAAGREGISVVGVDGQDFALEEIKKGGPFQATVKQDWDAIAVLTADLIEGWFAGEQPEEQQIELPGRLITAEDL